MKYCSKHHANPDDAIFCNECGERLFVSHKETKKCPNCNTENPIDAEFCHECGKHLSMDKQIPSSTGKYPNTSSNNQMGIMGWIVVGGLTILIAIFALGPLVGILWELIKLFMLIF